MERTFCSQYLEGSGGTYQHPGPVLITRAERLILDRSFMISTLYSAKYTWQ